MLGSTDEGLKLLQVVLLDCIAAKSGYQLFALKIILNVLKYVL